MPRIGSARNGIFSASDRELLFGLQLQALQYFLDNQISTGLVLDRQANRGALRSGGVCSLAATGMGCIALALAAEPQYDLLSPADATRRIACTLRTCLNELPVDHGVLPHFIDTATGAVHGDDACSTIETAWLVAGALWAAATLRDAEMQELADKLYNRIDWVYWSRPDGLIRHGKDRDGNFLRCAWDRLNGETAFMYVLAAGAEAGRGLRHESWLALRPFHGTVAGLRFASADLGLFVFQYGLDLLDFRTFEAPGPIDLIAEAAVATEANRLACRNAADRFATYRQYWGLSAGDGPGIGDGPDIYREYTPAGHIDGTAHLTATIASVAHCPGEVIDNLRTAELDPRLAARGRYGFSNVNVDNRWVSRDMVGIDVGATVLALDNVFGGNRVRSVFHQLPCIRRAVDQLGFRGRIGDRQAA
jgi:hypothetical protein